MNNISTNDNLEASLKRGLDDIKHGRVRPHEIVMAELRSLIQEKVVSKKIMETKIESQ